MKEPVISEKQRRAKKIMGVGLSRDHGFKG